MALPTITSNSPSAGYIAWTAFSIQYNGVSYSVAAGNTANKYTWWLYNNGAPTLNGGNTLPDLGPDDLLLFLNKTGVGVLVPTLDVVDGSLIVSGSILAASIGADQINASHIQANAVTTSELAANAVTATQIAAGAVTADKLSVGTVSDNMVVNGSFEDALSGNLVGWEINALTSGTITPVTGVASSGAVSMQMAATATTSNLRFRQLPAQYMPVSSASSKKYYVAFRAGANVATASGIYLRCNWYDGNKTFISSSDIRSNGSLTTTFTIYDGQATPPSTAKYMGMEILFVNMNVVATAYIDEVVVHEVTMSAQIGDGQITTPKLVTGAVTANVIAANAVTADKITISDFTNYLPGGNFDTTQDLANWSLGTGITLATTGQYAGSGCLQSVANAAVRSAGLLSKPQVVAGDTYFISFYFKSSADYAGAGGNAKVRLGDQSGNYLTAVTYTTVQTNWVRMTQVYTIPAGVTSLTPTVSFDHTAGTAYVDSLSMRRMSSGELIVDGSITALELATDSVTSDKILANAVTASEIAANAVYANHIAAGQIQTNHLVATAIDGMTITGASIVGGEVKTTPTANAIAARMGPTSVWDPFGNTNRPGIGFTVNGNTQDPAGMYSSTGTDLTIVQGGASQSGNQAYITLGNNNANVYSYNNTTVTGRSGVTVDGQVGTAVIKGTWIDLQSTNPLKVNGKDLSAGEVQVWDLSGNITNSTIPVVKLGSYVDNATLTTSSALATIDATPGIKITNAGVYDIHVSYGQNGGGVADSRNFVEIGVTNGDNYGKLLARSSFSNQEDSTSVSATGVKLAAGDIVKVEALQNSGGTRTYTARLRLNRVAAPVPVTAWGSGDQAITGNVTAGGKVTASGIVGGKVRQWQGYNSSFSVAANAQWDSGPVTADAGNSTDTAMCSPHSVPGAVMINETGFYMVVLYLTPASDPGVGHLHINYVSGSTNNLISRFATVSNGSATFETFVNTGPVYLTAGNYIRSELFYSNAHNVNSRWRIHKVDN